MFIFLVLLDIIYHYFKVIYPSLYFDGKEGQLYNTVLLDLTTLNFLRCKFSVIWQPWKVNASTSSFFEFPNVIPGEFVSGLRSMSRFLCGLCRWQVDEVTATSGQACSVFHKTRYSQLKSNSSWGSSLYTQNKQKIFLR